MTVSTDKSTFSNDLCGKSVTVTNVANKKSVKATIADECPGCANAQSIDLSKGAFDKIADESTGVIDSACSRTVQFVGKVTDNSLLQFNGPFRKGRGF